MEMGKMISVATVRARCADYVARIYEYPWRRVASELEMLQMIRDCSCTIRWAMSRGHTEATPRAKMHLVLELQETGEEVVAHMVRFSDFEKFSEAFETTERWLMTAVRNPAGREWLLETAEGVTRVMHSAMHGGIVIAT